MFTIYIVNSRSLDTRCFTTAAQRRRRVVLSDAITLLAKRETRTAISHER
jgi:hypothetical protein